MKQSWSDRTFTWFSVIVCLFIFIVMFYPFYYLLIYSFNDPVDASRGGVWFFPRKFSLASYETVFSTQNLWSAAWISVSRTVLGTFTSVLSTAMLAYALSRNVIGHRFFSKYFLVTMFVYGGIIPQYFMIKWVHLLETYWVYIIPGLISVFNMLLIRAYFQGLPQGLLESAEIDGASEARMFFQIAIPLSMPIIATISVFNAVGHWNSWQDNFFFASSTPGLTTLQMVLVNLLKSSTVTITSDNLDMNALNRQTITPESVRAAITIIVTAPIILVYPFFQRHFTQGIMLGSIKG